MYRTGDRVRWRGGRATWSSSAARTTRSRSAGSGSSRARSRARCCAHPGVAQAAVVARAGPARRPRLVAYVVGRRPTPAGCARAPRAQLPDYMVPSAVVRVDGRLPLTPNGKLDRPALPEPDWAGAAGRRGADHRRRAGAGRGCSPRCSACRRSAWTTASSRSAATASSRSSWSAGPARPGWRSRRARCSGSARSPRWPRSPDRRGHRARAPRTTAPGPCRPPRSSRGCATSTRRSTPSTSRCCWTCPDVDADRLAAALRRLVDHHDAAAGPAHSRVDTRGAARRGRASTCSTRSGPGADVARCRSGSPRRRLAPGDGRMLRAVWFRRRSRRLLLVAHHLVVDGVSWRILAEDLAALLARAASRPPGRHLVPHLGHEPARRSTGPRSCRSGATSSPARPSTRDRPLDPRPTPRPPRGRTPSSLPAGA